MNKRPKYILVVNSYLNRPGNFGQRAYKICEALEFKSEEFICISRGKINNLRYINLSIYGFIFRGINYLRKLLNLRFNHRAVERMFFEYLVIKSLKKSDLEGVVIHLWEYSPRLITHFQKRGAKVLVEAPSVPLNFIFELHKLGRGSNLEYYPEQEAIEFKSFELADLVISPSDFVTKYIKKGSGGVAVKTIPFGFPNTQIQSHTQSTVTNLLFVGNVDYRKGALELIEIMKLLKDENIHLHIVGREGNGAKEIRLSCLTNVSLHGFRNPNQYYEIADLFLFPTWCEGSAKVTYEAMSHGVPVITSPYAGSLVKNGYNGFVFEPWETTEIAEKIRLIHLNPKSKKKLSENCLTVARSRSDLCYVEDVIESYFDISNA